MSHYILTTALCLVSPQLGQGQIPNLSRTEPRFYRGIVFINQTFKASPGSRYKLTDARLATAWAMHSVDGWMLQQTAAILSILGVFALIVLIFIGYIQDQKIANLKCKNVLSSGQFVAALETYK